MCVLCVCSCQRAPSLCRTTRLEADERPFDCVAFFNPTTFDDYETTVNGWADALLAVINTSTLSLQEAATGRAEL